MATDAARPAAGAPPSANDLSYAEFGTWYDAHRQAVLEPALEAGLLALGSAMDHALSDRDLSRIRNIKGRVKSKRRTWRKLHQSQHAGQVASAADIPGEIHDLVGLRITCTNLRDIDTVQATLDALPTKRGKGRGLWVDMDSERDYVRAPKESGYRGWHVNLGVEIDQGGTRLPVTCELQVRTLLQDSWGELTHEDTYSKDGELPPLVEVLSKRIADLFATLDDIAEDLRTELDRIDEAAIAEVDSSATEPDSLTGSGQAGDAASVLLDRWKTMDRPMDLASMAWALQREFGAEISDDWFGYRSFKQFLTAAVPEGEISTGRQAYLLPRDYGSTGESDLADGGSTLTAPSEQAADDRAAELSVPRAARQLHGIDGAFPLLETETWPTLYTHVAAAWRRVGAIKPSPGNLNRLTRSARDRAEAAGTPLSRRHLDYVAKTVVGADEHSEPLGADEIAQRFAALSVQRMIDLRLIGAKNRKAAAAINAWLGAG